VGVARRVSFLWEVMNQAVIFQQATNMTFHRVSIATTASFQEVLVARSAHLAIVVRGVVRAIEAGLQ
jgi:hypothetical protein